MSTKLLACEQPLELGPRVGVSCSLPLVWFSASFVLLAPGEGGGGGGGGEREPAPKPLSIECPAFVHERSVLIGRK